MRQLNVNLAAGYGNNVHVECFDRPQAGSPTVRYDITGFNTAYNAAANDPSGPPAYFTRIPLIFQSGQPGIDAPPNGVTVDALLAVTVDHLHSKQQMLNASEEERMAMVYLQQALSLLQPQQNTVHATAPYRARAVEYAF